MTDLLRDCPACGHPPEAAEVGRCTITGIGTATGLIEYPGGCGCRALTPNEICSEDGARFFCATADLRFSRQADHPAHPCAAHRQAAFETGKLRDFAPLVAALRARGIACPDDPSNTGGHVMCLEFGLFPDTKPGAYPYLLVGDYGQFGASLSTGEGPKQGLSLWPSAVTAAEEEADDRWTPARAEKQAAWLASILPALRDWHRREVTVTVSAPYELFGGTVRDTVSDWAANPALPGTDVSDY